MIILWIECNECDIFLIKTIEREILWIILMILWDHNSMFMHKWSQREGHKIGKCVIINIWIKSFVILVYGICALNSKLHTCKFPWERLYTFDLYKQINNQTLYGRWHQPFPHFPTKLLSWSDWLLKGNRECLHFFIMCLLTLG